jgi:hypothetical protein
MLPLPLLESMIPSTALASSAAAKVKAPVRLAFIYSPNGVIMSDWRPVGTGDKYELPATLAPLAKVKQHFNVLTGLAHDNARSKGDGPGDHARSSAAFLTGAHPRKTSGSDIRLGVSIDQFAAQRIGEDTRLPSLELTCDRGRTAGNCDSGYSCAYQSNLSWRDETTPVPAELDPAQVFNRLFGSGDLSPQAMAARMARRKSVLDLVAEDARQLNRQLGKTDQRKLDEFSTSVREIEKRIEKNLADARTGKSPAAALARPQGIPREYGQHIRLMYDLLAMAFQTDQTRIAAFMLARDGSNKNFPEIGVTEGHHELSHHREEKDKINSLKKIDRFYITQFAYFLEKMASIREGDGSLLDHSMIVLGSAISDANRHTHHDLPVILAGRGGGTITPGRHLVYSQDTPMCNLYLNLLDRMGIREDRFGDSSGRLNDLTA